MLNKSKINDFRKISKTELELYLNQDNLTLKTIFNEISIGIIFLNYKKKSVLFANEFFKSISKKKEKTILENIFNYITNCLETKQKLNINQDMKIKENGKYFVFGFTTYQIYDEIVAVLLNEIASKSIYFETKQESQFFTKLSELVAEMAHEIGNPLSGITMSLEVLLHNIKIWPQEKIKDYIERTINEINRLSVFLKRIRDISNENELEMKIINLKSLIDDVFRQNEEILKKNKIKFKNMVEEHINIVIDEVAFFQIILNLLKNSLQILEPKKKVEIYVEDIDDFYIKLVYQNNGKPIPEKLRKKIFSPFFTTKDHGGGIGLSISQKLLTRMGGTIKAVQPENGKGAKFVIYLPNKIKK